MADTKPIVITMDADIDLVKKEIKAIDKELDKLQGKKVPLEAQMEAFNQKANEARRRLNELKKSADKAGMSEEIEKARKEMQEYADKADKACDELELINRQIDILSNRSISFKFTGTGNNSISEIGEQAEKSLGKAEQAAKRVSKEVGNTKTSFKSAGSAVENFGKRIANTFKSAFVFSVLYKGLNELKQRMSAMLSTNQQFTTSLNQVKSNLAVAFQPIYQAAMPAINALMQLIVKATAYIAAFVNAIFGKSLNSSISAAKKMEESVQAVMSGAKGSTAAEKELTNAIKQKQNQVKALQRENKQLKREYEQEKKAVEAQTDALEKQIKSLEKEIDAIQKSEDAANKAAAAQREAIGQNIKALQERQKSLQKSNQVQQKAFDEQVKQLQEQQKALQSKQNAETKAIDSQIKSFQQEIKVIQKAQKAAQEAKKANEKFTASFDELSTLGTVEEEDPYEAEIEKVQEKIDALQEEKEFKSEMYDAEREAIQAKIDKVQEEKQAAADAYDAQNERIQEQIELLQKSQDAIKDVDFSSNIEVYENKISAIREQIEALKESVVENPQIEQNELLIEQIQEEIDLLQEKKDALQDASGAATNFDASGITEFNEQLDKLKEKIEQSKLYQWIQDNKEEIKQFLTILGGLVALVVGPKGIVWAFSKFGDILKLIFATKGGIIGLVITALALLITWIANNQEAVDNIKEAVRLFGEGLTALIDGDFETFKTKFVEGFAHIENAGLAIWESLVNGLRKALRWIIQKLGALEKSVPEDSVWHNAFGADWAMKNWGWLNEEYHAERKIPALAQGAVLPPNKPFYAMLGDQHNGTNLEAPASLIEEIMRNVMADQQYNFNVTANGSLGALIRLLNLQFTRENNRETAF